MEPFQVNYSIIILFNILLAGVMLFSLRSKEPLYRPKISFIGLILSMVAWLVSLLILNSTQDLKILNFIGRFAFVGPMFVMFFFYFFTLNFPKLIYKSIYARPYVIVATLVGSIAAMTKLVLADIQIVDGSPVPVIGKAYALYSLLIVSTFLLSFYNLIKKYKLSSSIDKRLIKLVSFGFGTTVVTALITNLLIPSITGSGISSLLGPYSVVPFLVTVSAAILRHQFLDIRFLVGKVIYYSLLAIPPFFMFFGIAYLYQTAFGSVFSLNSYLVGIPVAYMFVGLFTFITGYAKKYTDTRLINPGYDPLEVIDELNRTVSNQLDIETISEKALEIVARTIRPEFQGIFVIPEEGPWLGFTYKEQQQPHPDDFRLILNVWDERNKAPLNYDELEARLSGSNTPAPQLMTEVLRVMKMYDLKVIFPLLQQERVAGMLLLGKKEADYPYSIQDTGFLNSIARTISLTVGRALLYEEIQQFNIELQAKVAKATLELKTKNANLEDALRKLEEARRQERDMVDVMGHELRTPLSIVRNAVVVLKEQKERDGVIPDEKLTKYLGIAAESIRREVGLVETLLTTTKLDSSRIQMDLTKISLKEVIHDSLLGHQEAAKDKNIQIEYDENTPDVFVYADRTRIQEITDNFLSNAIKYTNEGSVKIAIQQDEKTGGISITDTGVGISPEDIANLGKKFFRARSLYKEDNKYAHPSGTGLGLFVAFELIRIMDGERVITSVPGQGSTFAFKLPLFTGQPDKHIDQTFMGEPEGEITTS